MGLFYEIRCFILEEFALEMLLLGNVNCFLKLSPLRRLLKGGSPPQRCKEVDPVQSQLVLLKWGRRGVASRGLRQNEKGAG